MRNRFTAWMLLSCAGGLGAAAGCQTDTLSHIPTERQRREMLSLMLPQQIKIHAFTKIRSFNEDEIPDGILAVVRPMDRFGDPVKAVGLFYFELWTHVPASGERKGELLAHWERSIDSAEEVSRYWNRAQMYEFQLAWTEGVESLRPNQKYVFTATYRTPWDETIADEFVIEFHMPSEAISDLAPKG